MEESAVEWLEEELKANLKKVILEGDSELMESLFEQAKEMEKEQKIKFAEHCLDKALDLDIRTAFSNVEQYYNQTFKSK